MKSITAETNFVGLLGNPVRHSLSPIIHNIAFEILGINWCYLAMPCKKENLKTILEALKNLNCMGLNITIPHKENIAFYCEKESENAKEIGAINTLLKNENNIWIGENTDMEGFIYPLKEKDWKNKKAIILGNGGSARAVLVGLKKLMFEEIYIIGKNKEKLNSFLNFFKENNINNNTKIKGIIYNSTDISTIIVDADLIVNTTPIGMRELSSTINNIESIPFGATSWEKLNKKTTLYDLIYTPYETDWLKIGKSKGCDTINGLSMLIQQGAESLRLWSGFQEIPTNQMTNKAIEYLKK